MPAAVPVWTCEIIDNQAGKAMVWQIEDKTMLARLLDYCHNASPYTQTFEIDEREGYNGVRLFSNNEHYTAFVGKLTYTSNGKKEIKTDLGRKLEQMILSIAPEQYRQKALSILTIDFD